MKANAGRSPRVSISLVAPKSKTPPAKFQLNARSLGFGKTLAKASSDIKTEPPENDPPAEPPHRLPETKTDESQDLASNTTTEYASGISAEREPIVKTEPGARDYAGDSKRKEATGLLPSYRASETLVDRRLHPAWRVVTKPTARVVIFGHARGLLKCGGRARDQDLAQGPITDQTLGGGIGVEAEGLVGAGAAAQAVTRIDGMEMAQAKPNLGRNGSRKGEEKPRVNDRSTKGAKAPGNGNACNADGEVAPHADAPALSTSLSLSTEGATPAPVVIIKERAVDRPVREGWKPCPPRDPEKPNRGKFRLRGLKTDGTTGPRPGVEIIRPASRDEGAGSATIPPATAEDTNETDSSSTTSPISDTTQAADAVKLEKETKAAPAMPKKSLLVTSLTLPPDAEIWAFRGDMLDNDEVKDCDVINAATLETVQGGIDAALGFGDADLVFRERSDPAAFASFLDSGHPPHQISLCLAGAKGGRAYLTGTLAALDLRSNLYVVEAEETFLTIEVKQPKADPFVADLRMDDLELDADPFALIDDFYDSKTTPPPVPAPVEKKVVVVSKRPIKGVLIKGDRIAAGKLGV
ncbi:hypothetical protein HDU86_000129 [Geranomyces michiganensis]|nr:hypothetical protein HDU86_000129 [Geranomyces michiganensis]